MTYQELQKALAIFGLERRATLPQIKQRYRELAKLYHPDTRQAAAGSDRLEDEKEIRQINAAYRLLLAYTSTYAFSFSEEEFYLQNPDQQLQRQFGNDPLWGDGRG